MSERYVAFEWTAKPVREFKSVELFDKGRVLVESKSFFRPAKRYWRDVHKPVFASLWRWSDSGQLCPGYGVEGLAEAALAKEQK